MSHYADAAHYQTVEIVEQVAMATDTYRLRFAAPKMAAQALPGQFFMVRIHGCNDPLIGRALAMYDRVAGSDGQPCFIDVAYLVKGKFTTRLATLQPQCKIDVWGPLGNSFSTQATDHLILVVGGVGYTPMLTLGREALGGERFGSTDRPTGYAQKVTLCYGARSFDRLAGLPEFNAANMDVRICTDDGSYGTPKNVTSLLNEVLEQIKGSSLQSGAATPSIRIACCGPEPMMAAVAKIATEKNISCEVSLETPMACGIGICFTCVAKVLQSDGSWDYQRTCVEGPIFDAAKLNWS